MANICLKCGDINPERWAPVQCCSKCNTVMTYIDDLITPAVSVFVLKGWKVIDACGGKYERDLNSHEIVFQFKKSVSIEYELFRLATAILEVDPNGIYYTISVVPSVEFSGLTPIQFAERIKSIAWLSEKYIDNDNVEDIRVHLYAASLYKTYADRDSYLALSEINFRTLTIAEVIKNLAIEIPVTTRFNLRVQDLIDVEAVQRMKIRLEDHTKYQGYFIPNHKKGWLPMLIYGYNWYEISEDTGAIEIATADTTDYIKHPEIQGLHGVFACEQDIPMPANDGKRKITIIKKSL